MLVHGCAFDRPLRHRRHHMGGLDPACFNPGHIERMRAVNESAVPFVIRIEIWTKSPVYKNVDGVSEADEQLKMKSLDEKGQDVLSANSLETRRRAVPVLVLSLEPLQLVIVCVFPG